MMVSKSCSMEKINKEDIISNEGACNERIIQIVNYLSSVINT